MCRDIGMCLEMLYNGTDHSCCDDLFAGCGISSMNLPDMMFSKQINQKPVGLIPSPEPANTMKVMREAILDMWRWSSYGMFIKSPLTAGERILHKGFLASFVADRVAR